MRGLTERRDVVMVDGHFTAAARSMPSVTVLKEKDLFSDSS
jgi:hypothetical protein